eukprot:XP_011661776.1 PREDICTED: uncharacterized protein K02A2.6-like [Strongylocentrotus purpuratus]
MASCQIPVPQPMCCKGNLEANWKAFGESWSDYRIATELDKKPDIVQVATLRTVMGQDCKDRLATLPLSDEDRKNPQIIIEKLAEHFAPARNVLYDRFVFHSASQQQNESVDQYVVRLRQLGKACKFGALEEEMIRDRLVLGCKDKQAQARLFREQDTVCTLKKAIASLEVSESSQQQLRIVKGEESVHFTQSQHKKGNAGGRQMQTNSYMDRKKYGKSFSTQKEEMNGCKFCGGSHSRGRDNCPAYGKTCRKCGRANHFQTVCNAGTQRGIKSSYVHQLESSDDEDALALEEVGSLNIHDGGKKLTLPLDMVLNGKQQGRVECLIDTGSTCNVLSYRQVCELENTGQPIIAPSKSRIRLINRSIIPVLGEKTYTCRYGNKQHVVTFKIVDVEHMPLLSSKTSIDMGLITVNVDHEVNMVEDNTIIDDYADVFDGLGCLPGEYDMKVDSSITSVKNLARKVAVPLKGELKLKLDELEQRGILRKVSIPTDWVSNIVLVRKPGKLRICLDPRDLNRALKRPHYLMPTMDDILPKLAEAKVFSVLDAKDGFWQVKLTERSSLLTTFATPFGRYRWTRMPFGICTAPEEFQRRQHEIIEGLLGVDVVADDFLVYGSGATHEEALADHDRNLQKFLARARESGLILNKKKLKLRLKEVPYMGHLLTSDGLKPDPKKVKAVVELPAPTDKKGVQRLLGSVTYLSRFMPRLADVAEPLRRLTDKGVHFEWREDHEETLNQLRKLMTEAPILKYYDLKDEVTIQCDASEKGLGATLLQNGQPVYYASRALTKTEQNYAQIEKECLAIVYSAERFDQFIQGRKVTIMTDHKPLVPIFSKALNSAPKRLQRMLLRLQKYDIELTFCPGKDMLIADWLSRAFLPDTESCDRIYAEIEQINQTDYVRIRDATSLQLQKETLRDPAMQTLTSIVMNGWPEQRDEVPVVVRGYYQFRDEITVQNGVLYKGMKVIVPTAMRALMLNRVHSSHLGVDACVRRARDVLFWPGMQSEVKEKVTQCSTCNAFQPKQQKEPMMSHDIPSRPWSIVSQDLFTFQNEDYLITVDHYSDYWEIDKITGDTRAPVVVACTKGHFARYGRPDKVITDNGPQFVAKDYAQFVAEWEVEHLTSSPLYAQSNGKAESAVKIAKTLLKKATKQGEDVQLAILDWRNTPDDNGASPAQKMMARRTNTLLPTPEALLKPHVVDGVSQHISHKKQQAKKYYDRSAAPLPELEIGQQVRIQSKSRGLECSRGVCKEKVGPRSYLVQTETGQMLRRNRRFLRMTEEPLVQEPLVQEPLVQEPQTAEKESPSAQESPQEATASQQTGENQPQQPSYTETLQNLLNRVLEKYPLTALQRVSRRALVA